MTLADLIVLVAGVLAGGLNAIAGGGTLLSFPVLIAVGLPPTIANATNAVALVPGQLGSAWALRSTLAGLGRTTASLLVPTLIGGVIGAWALLRTPEGRFRQLAPLLVLVAAALLAAQEPLGRWLARRSGQGQGEAPPADAAGGEGAPSGRGLDGRLALVLVAQLIVAVYGGYFGGGMGIAMLAVLGWLPGLSLHSAQALKAVLGATTNAVAAVLFLAQRSVSLRYAAVMAVGALLGGYLLGRSALRLRARTLRRVVIAIALAVAAWLTYDWLARR